VLKTSLPTCRFAGTDPSRGMAPAGGKTDASTSFWLNTTVAVVTADSLDLGLQPTALPVAFAKAAIVDNGSLHAALGRHD
jgi:hypothetical protein